MIGYPVPILPKSIRLLGAGMKKPQGHGWLKEMSSTSG
jgi:hypothetical protein